MKGGAGQEEERSREGLRGVKCVCGGSVEREEIETPCSGFRRSRGVTPIAGRLEERHEGPLAGARTEVGRAGTAKYAA